MTRWLGLAADWLRPVYEHLRLGLAESNYIQIDETSVEYLAPGSGQTKRGCLWVCNQTGADVVFHWQTSRAATCVEKIIPVNFQGVLQCDGYAAYRSFTNGRGENVQLAGCYAHVRRKFHEAQEQAPQIAGWLLRQIALLYKIERQLRQKWAGPRLRAAIRASQSRLMP